MSFMVFGDNCKCFTCMGRPLLLAFIVILTACGGGGNTPVAIVTPSPTTTPTLVPTPNPTPGYTLAQDNTPDPVLPLFGSDLWNEAVDASRFLTQASFGPTAKSIDHLIGMSHEAWINEQMVLPQTPHLALLDARFEQLGWEATPDPEDDDDGYLRDLQRSDIWWEIMVRGDDQLRQRVAYALSQIFVISNVSDVLYNDTRGIANYHDMLATHAFGNYRDLLEAVTLHPMMGEYLSMVRNEKADSTRNIRPDENYAREVMQLFSIGLIELNTDGSTKTNATDKPIPTYNQNIIKAFAKVFTGWNYATADQWWEWKSDAIGEVLPMKPFETIHDKEPKTLLNSMALFSNRTAVQDMKSAMDNLFNHSNVGPFIGKQLIQRLITSNPTPEYVGRVAAVFNNNGSGVRGDLGAVIKAIFLDAEARTGHITAPSTFGKLREPILQVSAIWRAFKVKGIPVAKENGTLAGFRLRYWGSDRDMGQRPYGAFSVFNYYRPNYQHPGSIAGQNLLSPEFQILTESLIISKTNRLASLVFWRDQTFNTDIDPIPHNWDIYPPFLNLEEEKNMANNSELLLDRLNLILCHGNMTIEMRNLIIGHINKIELTWDNAVRTRVFEALVLVVTSPIFSLQR